MGEWALVPAHPETVLYSYRTISLGLSYGYGFGLINCIRLRLEWRAEGLLWHGSLYGCAVQPSRISEGPGGVR